MISMTGYGKSKITHPDFEIETEIKSVNGKFLELKLYIPKELNRLEMAIRNILTSTYPRGTVEIRFKYTDHSEPDVKLNTNALKKIIHALDEADDLKIKERKIGRAHV